MHVCMRNVYITWCVNLQGVMYAGKVNYCTASFSILWLSGKWYYEFPFKSSYKEPFWFEKRGGGGREAFEKMLSLCKSFLRLLLGGVGTLSNMTCRCKVLTCRGGKVSWPKVETKQTQQQQQQPHQQQPDATELLVFSEAGLAVIHVIIIFTRSSMVRLNWR